MTSSINHDQEYQQAQKAYIQGNYEEAAILVDKLVQDLPNDPNCRLLRGHIYCVLRQYETAREQYQLVLQFTEDIELIDCAKNGLESVKQYESSDQMASGVFQSQAIDDTFLLAADSPARTDYLAQNEQEDSEDWYQLTNYAPHSSESSFESEHPFGNTYEETSNINNARTDTGEYPSSLVDPFNLNQAENLQATDTNEYANEYKYGADLVEQNQNSNTFETDSNFNFSFKEVTNFNSHFANDSLDPNLEESEFSSPSQFDQWLHSDIPDLEDATLLISAQGFKPNANNANTEDDLSHLTIEEHFPTQSEHVDFTSTAQPDWNEFHSQQNADLAQPNNLNGFYNQDSADLNNFERSGAQAVANTFQEEVNQAHVSQNGNIDFIEEFELPPAASQLMDSGMLSSPLSTLR